MGIILKTTFKNIFGKPLRSLLVIFSIYACAFAALFCFDLTKTEKQLLTGLLSEMSGDADMAVQMSVADLDKLPDNLPENKAFIISYFSDTIYTDIPGEYAYVSTDDLSIRAVDTIKAHQFGYLDVSILPKYHCIITDIYARTIGYTYGTPVVVHDNSGNEVRLTVDDVIPADAKNLLLNANTVIVSEETGLVLSCGKPVGGRVLIDIIDDSRISEAEEILQEAFGKEKVMSFALNDESNEILNELFGFLFILFAVTFLLVVFITFSICERIVGDRMSFIGTLRSLGLSSRATAFVLLLENVSYALLGSIPGIILYLDIRGPMYDALMYIELSDGMTLDLTIPELSKALVVSIVIGAILVECLIPLKAVLRALKMSIRDIIFDNRDTAYRFNRAGIITGIVMAVIALVTFIAGKSLFGAGVCLIASVMALSFLFPLILKGVTNVLGRIAEKTESGKMALAVREAISRKSTVASGVLCATSATMCVIIYIIATSMMGLSSADIYDCDVHATVTDQAKKLSFIPYLDGVTDTEFLYDHIDYIRLEDSDKDKAAQIIGMPDGGFRLYNGISGLPDVIEEGTVYIESGWASRNGYSVGDTMVITFDAEGVFPIRKELVIGGFIKLAPTETMKNDFVISLDEYKSIYHDYPGELMVKADDPEAVRDAIKTYGVGSAAEVKTMEELLETEEKDNAQSDRVFVIIVIVALGMTCIGMITNQIIGFEGRKKECAVMLSTSMTRKTLAGILFREMFITSVTSATCGCIFGTLLIAVIKRAVDNAEALNLPVNIHFSVVLTLWVVMSVIFALTVLFPIKNMRKMKLSEQLKYE